MDQSSGDDRLPPHLIERSIQGMSAPDAYPHSVGSVEGLETHISWVFLAGKYAYKVKKPVALGFLDFTKLKARRHFCEEELRLNQRFAPRLYLDVVAVRGSFEAPHVDGTGEVIEYALRMRRFPQEAPASNLLACGRFTSEHMGGFATDIARFHTELPPSGAGTSYGTPASILHAASANFEQVELLLGPADNRILLEAVRRWTEDEFSRRRADFQGRQAQGMIRECHGDLHLHNIVE